LREYAPAISLSGAALGGLVGLAFGAPVVGAVWGASILTALPAAVIVAGFTADQLDHLRRGDGRGTRVGEALRFLGGICLPTAVVAAGALLGAMTAPGVALAAALGASAALTLGGRLFLPR
jgi:hypothetical protein